MSLAAHGRDKIREITSLESPLDSRRDLPAGRKTRLHRLLRATNAALEDGDLEKARRFMDAAWRRARDKVAIAHAYGRLLLRLGDSKTALARLTEAAAIDTGPELDASVLDALLSARGSEAACQHLQASLHKYAVAPGGPLFVSASRVVLSGFQAIRGWVGIAPTLELIGQIRGTGTARRLVVRTEDGACLQRHVIEELSGDIVDFRIALPRERPHAALTVTIDDEGPLLGSGLTYPPAFCFDGRAHLEDGDIVGWATLGWLPSSVVDVIVEDEHGACIHLPNPESPDSTRRQRFRINPRDAGLTGHRFTVSAQLPDGTVEPFPDSPILVEDRLAAQAPPGARPQEFETPRFAVSDSGRRRGVDIIVPVYLGREETMACITSLLRTIDGGTDVIVVDDASPDAQLSAALRALENDGSITLLRNDTNLGFAASVNRALAIHEQRDVVLLNSDTVVHGNWLERLRAAAYSAPNIATATPLTNNGSIASYATDNGETQSGQSAAALDSIAATVNSRVTVDLPVGVGFCLFLRRDCLRTVGEFDAITFGKGYGEENDFCMRATQQGWRHVLAADVFVHHAGARSFGARRDALMERNGRALNRRFPEYPKLVRDFVAADPIAPLRRRLDEARLGSVLGKHVLLVSLSLTGGVDRFVRERSEALRKSGFSPLLIRPTEGGLTSCFLSSDDATMRDLRYDIPDEIDDLTRLLRGLTIDHVELHHFLDCDHRFIEAVIALGIPHDVYVHDYSWICPRLTLLGGKGHYCGEPELPSCEACVRIYGANRSGTPTVASLRERSGRWLASAREIVVPCNDVAARIVRHFPTLKPRIEPWETDVVRGTAPTPAGESVRIAVIGGIGVQKGYQVLLDCASDAAARNLPLEFIVFGYTEDDEALFETGRAFVTGRYDDSEIRDLLRRERPHLTFFPSVTPETWCYSLSHAISVGLPIVAFDFGAIAERLRATNGGTLIPWTPEPAVLNDRLLKAAKDAWSGEPSGSRAARIENVATAMAMPAQQSKKSSEVSDQERKAHMADPARSPAESPSSDGISASVRILSLPKGLYLFSVRAASPARVAEAQDLTLPAVHVGLGPGASPHDIEFLPGPRTSGTWLCDLGDTLVANITAAKVTLILTSVRAPNGQVLAIELDRLDRPTDVAVPAQQEISFPARPGDIRPAQALVTDTAVGRGEGEISPASEKSARTVSGVRIVAHVRHRGDIEFVDADWAGRVGPGLWIEAFSVASINALNGLEIEYKGLTSRGIETPWVSSGGLCGTRGMSVPLLGFALRVKSNARFDCEYSGYFKSGVTVGPLRNGAPCRSTIQNDPLEGIRLRVIARQASTADMITASLESMAALADQRWTMQPRLGPQFSRLREEAVPGAPAVLRPRLGPDAGNANLGRFLRRLRTRDPGLGVLPKIPKNPIVGIRGPERTGERAPVDSDVNLPDERQS